MINFESRNIRIKNCLYVDFCCNDLDCEFGKIQLYYFILYDIFFTIVGELVIIIFEG